MLFAPLLAENSFNWTGLILTLIGVAVGWTILRFVLRLTMKIFAIGCLGLLIFVGGVFTYFYWDQLMAVFR